MQDSPCADAIRAWDSTSNSGVMGTIWCRAIDKIDDNQKALERA